MKKLITLALALLMVLSLAACGGGNDTPDPSGSNDPGTSQQTDPGTSASQQEQTGGDTQNDTDENSTNEPLSIDPALLAEKAKLYRLPGLTLPENSTAEFDDSMAQISIIRNEDFTETDLHAYAQTVWELCSEISPDGIYMGEVVGGELRKSEEYTSLEAAWTVDTYVWYYTCENECVMISIKLFSLWGKGEVIKINILPSGTIG